jgi:hypothetical protein
MPVTMLAPSLELGDAHDRHPRSKRLSSSAAVSPGRFRRVSVPGMRYGRRSKWEVDHFLEKIVARQIARHGTAVSA